MVSNEYIEEQLKKLHTTMPFWVRAEVRELQHILVDGETIEHILTGRYEGGFAILCATNYRVLLIDKKPFFLTLEDVRYDKIVQTDFSYRMLDATVTLCTPGQKLLFTSFRKNDARAMAHYIQNRILDIRQVAMISNSQALAAQQPAPLPTGAVSNLAFTPQTAGGDEEMTQSRLPAIFVPRSISPYMKTAFLMRKRPSRFHGGA